MTPNPLKIHDYNSMRCSQIQRNLNEKSKQQGIEMVSLIDQLCEYWKDLTELARGQEKHDHDVSHVLLGNPAAKAS